MFILQATTKAFFPGWLETLALLLAAFLLGWLFRKFMRSSSSKETELEVEITRLRRELEDCRSKPLATVTPVVDTAKEAVLKAEVNTLVAELKGSKDANNLLRARLSDIENNPSLAISPFITSDIDAEDLTKIEGIGPKIAALCNGIGVYTFKQLSITSVGQLQEMLDDAGPRYKVHSPNTWPAQASLAAQGLWDQLNAWQAILDGGKI